MFLDQFRLQESKATVCACGRLPCGAGFHVTFALNTLIGFCEWEPVILEMKFQHKHELQFWDFCYPQL